jgi:hypothetical protein
MSLPVSRRAWMLGLLPIGAIASPSQPPQEIARILPDARLVGQGRLRFFGLTIYDIRLWSAAQDSQDVLQRPFGLELEYARALKGEKIAERSIDEMRRIGAFSAEQGRQWLEALKRLFPDVAPGDRLTGLQRSGNHTEFFFNGAARGEVKDIEFARLFFGIWLSPNTSEPRLRDQLLGLPAEPRR